MSISTFGKVAVASVVLLGTSTASFGAAALAGGAKTSCKPTATNPAQRQIQINADPLNVVSFGLTMTYENDKVFIGQGNIFGLNGYTVNDTTTSVVGNLTLLKVFGSSANPLPGENDVYGIIFTLNEGLPLDTVLHFSVSDANNDFITAFDTDTSGNVTFNGRSQVAASFSGPVAILPEPGVAAMGLLVAGGMMGRRRK